MEIKPIENLKPFEARAIIEHLRKGSVPIEYVKYFTVGRDKWLSLIVDDLENYIKEGGAKVRFVNGDYGDGKTHFMSIIRHLAKEKKFAVTFVVLTREVPMHRFENIYREIVRQLVGDFSGTGIRDLLETWLNKVKAEVDESADRFNEIIDEISALISLDQNYKNGLCSLLRLYLQPLDEQETEDERENNKELLLRWFAGDKILKRDLKPFGIYDILNKNNVKYLLESLITFLRYLGYHGLVLLMDELETVMASSASIRNAAYESVRLLIDNTERIGYLHIFMAIIPEVIQSEKGFKCYDALWSRIKSIGEHKRLNYRNTLIDIHQTPLQTEELIELGEQLRTIHEISYRWKCGDNLNKETFAKICKNQEKIGLRSEVRLFIKQVVGYLDLAEQGEFIPDEHLAEHLLDSQKALTEESIQSASWDS